MFAFLLAAFIAVPLIEIALFIEVGGAIGTFATIAIVIFTAVLGAWMLRAQGLATARRAQMRFQNGEIPIDQAFDGMFLVFAGALLLTPGFLTDALGFALFVPQVRAWLRGRLVRWAQRSGGFTVVYGADPGWPAGPGGPEGAAGPAPPLGAAQELTPGKCAEERAGDAPPTDGDDEPGGQQSPRSSPWRN